MFKKDDDLGHYYILDCGVNTYILEYDNRKSKIYGRVFLCRGSLFLHDCDYDWCNLNYGPYYDEFQIPIEELVNIFNQQILEQIQKSYEPGGKMFMECEGTIKELLRN